MDEAAMIDAMAGAICERRNAPDWPCNGLDFDMEMARVALAAVAPMIQAMKAEATREALEEAAVAVVKRAEALDRKKCCGVGSGSYNSPPECCCKPVYMISECEADHAIRALIDKPSA